MSSCALSDASCTLFSEFSRSSSSTLARSIANSSLRLSLDLCAASLFRVRFCCSRAAFRFRASDCAAVSLSGSSHSTPPRAFMLIRTDAGITAASALSYSESGGGIIRPSTGGNEHATPDLFFRLLLLVSISKAAPPPPPPFTTPRFSIPPDRST